MKTKICVFILFLFASTSAFAIQWQTDYSQAVNQAKMQSKPIFLFFTGKGWCSYCTKLENEVLKTQDFQNAVGNKFVFVEIDYQHGKVNPTTKKLMDRYKIKGFPTVVLIDSQENVIGEIGYKPGGGKKYGEMISQMIN